ncbi:hypothetical protein J7M07_06825 [bacterium]|nr:hypothetical protein [bacterium]
MRLLLRQQALVLIVLAIVILPLGKAFASDHGVFITRASSMSNELDNRWDQIRQSHNRTPINFSITSTSFARTVSRKKIAIRHRGDRINWSYVNTSFTKRGPKRLLPFTTTPRNKPTRGTATFDHPARGYHRLSCDRRRPASSQNYKRRGISQRGSVSRPKLTHFGRTSTGKRRSGVGNHISPFATRVRRR